MLLATIETIKQEFKVLGMVCGSVVQTHHALRDILLEVKSLIGQSEQESLVALRMQACKKMEYEASLLGADAIIGIRYETCLLPEKSFEVFVCGTAIAFLPQEIKKNEAHGFQASYVEKCVKMDLQARLQGLREKNKGL